MSYAKALPLLAVLCLATRFPDEGQWLPSQVRTMDWQKLRARGMQLSPDQLWDPQRGGLLNAAVQINYPGHGHCTASFVSSEGLLITNHHCGDEAIGQLSTLRHNYLKEGFVARSLEEELQTNMVVYVVRRIEDVTAKIHAAQQRAGNDLQRYDYAQQEIKRLVEEGEKNPATGEKDPMTECEVASFFEGREYQLYYRTRINDVRLVYAPPGDAADYGGNVDNWEWPRHSGDFVFFRAFVAPDGTPLPYHEGNVPYRPQHWLQVATDGVGENDLVLILGYPALTLRYLSSVAVQNQQGYVCPKRSEIFHGIVDALEDAVAGDPERHLKLSSAINAFANAEKNSAGMIAGLARNAVVDRKIREEESFAAWAKSNGHPEYFNALQDLLELDQHEQKTQEQDLLLGLLSIGRLRDLVPILDTMLLLVRSAVDSEEGEEVRYPPELLARIGSEDAPADLELLQKPVLEVLLEEVRNLPADQQLSGSTVLADSDVPKREMVNQLLAATEMLAAQKRLELLRAGRKAVAASTDPLVVLARGFAADMEAHDVRVRTTAGRRMVLGPVWIAAQQAWRGTAFYPDANATLRISIATVQGYSPRDAITHRPFTTVGGMLEKNTGTPPFKLPDEIKEAARRRWLSRFRDKELGDVPVCFLSNGDTTNGNSGSPVINGKGELVGLNFDRVFENVACDFGWNPDTSRNISLDMRFVLWHLESAMPAPRLLREMGVN
jgi:hypothetical protein